MSGFEKCPSCGRYTYCEDYDQWGNRYIGCHYRLCCHRVYLPKKV